MRESGRDLKVVEGYDIAVVGGGIAGIAAALSAARLGAKTCLIEKYCGLGGLATLGNVVVYLPICDGEGRQAIGGLGEELLHLAAADGYDQVPEVWMTIHSAAERSQQRFLLRFNAPSFMLALEKMLLEEGVSLWYDTSFSNVICSQEKIDALIVQNKSGRLAIRANIFVDCSGDADVCFASGEETVSLNTNVRSNWFFYNDAHGIHCSTLSEPFSPDGLKQKDIQRGYRGDNGKDVSAHVVDSHQLLRERLAQIQKQSSGAYLVNIPTIPSMRMTRRLEGEVVLSEEHAGIILDDVVGLCPSWRESGVVYGIPFRALRAVCMNNLITGGRCISASGRLWDLTRAIPVCALTGEIAGTAAALACSQHDDLRTLCIETLQQQLLSQQNILDLSLVRGS